MAILPAISYNKNGTFLVFRPERRERCPRNLNASRILVFRGIVTQQENNLQVTERQKAKAGGPSGPRRNANIAWRAAQEAAVELRLCRILTIGLEKACPSGPSRRWFTMRVGGLSTATVNAIACLFFRRESDSMVSSLSDLATNRRARHGQSFSIM